ncbi:MAG: metalloregulator ArsR/SmtB family transcription factor [Pseudomonadales bacterium]
MANPLRSSPAAGEDADAQRFDALVVAAKAVADGQRACVLRLLKEESYGVLELCRLLDTPQPALSHHLKVLHQAGLVAKRREGNTIFYRRAPAPTALHRALLEAIDEIDLAEQHRARIETVHQQRSQRSEAFFAEHAEHFKSNQARISEAAVYVGSVLEIVDRTGLGAGTALEIGPGEGELLRPLAQRFHQVVAIDSARSMLDQSARQVADLDNVRLLHRDVATLHEPSGYQLLVAAMVVHHLPSPQRFFRQARRLLERNGVLIVVELCRHEHQWAHAACGDLWLGFEAAELAHWAANAGFAAGESQFLAQKNGFRIQIHTYLNHSS